MGLHLPTHSCSLSKALQPGFTWDTSGAGIDHSSMNPWYIFIGHVNLGGISSHPLLCKVIAADPGFTMQPLERQTADEKLVLL